ncbi:solute carrier family 2 member 11, like isoform X2 [Nerophis lumbriciformis]|uniref:solute carrier family 2 member 11, like isoform X2 n=1 Tax=Nerophis lumbriciformis TaxID=546530 RepID=UPI002ADFD608|nr:solute carrier family 2, facilitated glucose transporter member 9-like isoform X2 [Nerophis lumbriciformis]
MLELAKVAFMTSAMPQHLTLLLDCPLVIAAIFTLGIGGTFQYGFCISVVTSSSTYIKELLNQTCLERYEVRLTPWHISLIWSFIVSLFCVGGLLGTLLAPPIFSKYGRRTCLLLNNLLAIMGAVLMLFSRAAASFEMIMAARLLYGINSGVSLSTQSVYLVECAPKMLRGMVGVTIATFIAAGKFTGQLLGISELLGTEERWHFLLAFNALPALFQLLTLPFLPESPKFLLLERGDQQACQKAVTRLWGKKDHSSELEDMLEEKAALQNVTSRSVMELLQDGSIRWQVITIVVTFSSLQLCGINAVYFYSYEVFAAAGIQQQQLAYAALGTGLCEMMASLACFVIIESAGKKVLLSRGCLAMAAALALLTVTLHLQQHIYWMSYCSMVLIFTFIALFSTGPGGTTAPLPGVIFTQAYKSSAYLVACTINWTGMFTVGMVFPILVENLGSLCFILFLLMCLCCGLYVLFHVPEMNNKTPLEIATDFQRLHNKSLLKSPDVAKTQQTKF